jgi:hypothetical protein
MNQVKELERLAIDAHHRGETWAAFWNQHGNEVKAAEPYNRQRLRRLVNRLLSLVVSGDLDGQEPPSILEPWELDDSEANKPADTGTQARFDWEQLSGNEVIA